MKASFLTRITELDLHDPQRDWKLSMLLHEARAAKWMSGKTRRRIDKAIVETRKAWEKIGKESTNGS